MGYEVTLKGRIKCTDKASEKMMRWLNVWCTNRHVQWNTDKVMEKDGDYLDKLPPSGHFGDSGILYAGSTNNALWLKEAVLKDAPPKVVGDYYLPIVASAPKEQMVCLFNREAERNKALKMRREPQPVGTNPEFSVSFVPSPIEKPHDIKTWLDFIFGCPDIMGELGQADGALLAVGEEFGDATYYIVSHNEVREIPAYCDGANLLVRKFIGDNKTALQEFEKIYRNPVELEYEWCDED